jgi:hypothetical protein
MPLEFVNVGGLKVADWSPLASRPLRDIGLDRQRYDPNLVALLRSIRTLQTVNGVALEAGLASLALPPAPTPVDEWAVIGPFAAKDRSDLDAPHPPDREVDFSREYAGLAGPVRWRRATAKAGAGDVDLRAALGAGDNRTAYAVAILHVPAATDAVIGLGSDDASRAWLNDREFHRETGPMLPANSVRATVRLAAGRNVLRIKVVNGMGAWGFSVHIGDRDGKPIPGLKIVPPEVPGPPGGAAPGGGGDA